MLCHLWQGPLARASRRWHSVAPPRRVVGVHPALWSRLLAPAVGAGEPTSPRLSGHSVGRPLDLKYLKPCLGPLAHRLVVREAFLEVELNACFRQPGASAHLYKNGCAVLWHMSEATEAVFLELLRESSPYSSPVPAGAAHEFSEEMAVHDTTSPTSVQDTAVQLTGLLAQRQKDKLALAFALMTAVRLNVLERTIDHSMEAERANISKLNALMNSWSLERVTRLLFASVTSLHHLRFELNIKQDLLDVPEIFWEHESQSLLFVKTQKLFDVKQRVDVLNARISWMKDCLDSYSNYVDHKHGARLEMIIIALIALELGLSIGQMGGIFASSHG